MREFALCSVLIFNLLFSQAHAQFCLSSGSTNTNPINVVRESSLSSSNHECLPCLPECFQCTSPEDSSCASGSCATFHYYDSQKQKCLRCPDRCESCERISGTSEHQNMEIKNILRIPYPYFHGLKCMRCAMGYYLKRITK